MPLRFPILNHQFSILNSLFSIPMTLSTAESCTGGRIAAAITAQSGASRYFTGGLVAYQNEVKERMLGVPHQMIEQYGVVSRQVAEQMVRGACRLFGTDYALASTGYAEPWQGHEVEIWVAWGCEGDVHAMCLREDFGRLKNVEIATQCVMEEFNKYLCMHHNPLPEKPLIA